MRTFLLYDSSNCLPSSDGSSVSASLQYMQRSTRPSIFVCFPQLGHSMTTAFVDNKPIHTYTAVLAKIHSTPNDMKSSTSHGLFLKKIPPYIMTNPINMSDNANVRILLILFEYFFIMTPPLLQVLYYSERSMQNVVSRKRTFCMNVETDNRQIKRIIL